MTGTQRRKTTGETSRKKAREIADKYEQMAQGKVSRRGFQEIVAELYKEQFGESMPTATLEEFVEYWLKTKKSTVATSTLKFYECSAEYFLKFMGDARKMNLLAITSDHLISFRNYLSTRHRPITVNVHLEHLKNLFHYAKRSKYIFENPAETVECVRNREKPIRRDFTIPELEALLAVADTEWTSMIKFGLYTTQRLADICQLTWNDIDFEHNRVHFHVGKTGKDLKLEIAPPLREHLESMPSSDTPGAPLHPRAFKQFRGSGSNNVSRAFTWLLARAGLREPRKEAPRGTKPRLTKLMRHELSFHSLRHTGTSLLVQAGVPEATVRAITGHSNKVMAQHYMHISEESMRKAVESFPKL